MPTCLASSSGLLRASAHPSSSHKLVHAFQCNSHLCRTRRYASTAAAPTVKHEDQRAHVLTVLHKTTSLLPRILPHQGSTSQGVDTVSRRDSLHFWEEVLGKVYEDLTLTAEKRERDCVRVAVYGLDWQSGADELVTALLEDPFVSDEQKHVLRTRWEGQSEGSRTVKLRYGTSPSPDGDVVCVQSSWLQDFGVPIEVSEFRPLPSPTPDLDSAKALFTADIPVILCNPVSTPLTHVLSPSTSSNNLPVSRKNTILAIFSPSPSRLATSEHTSQIPTLTWQDDLHVLYVDPSRACHGLEMLSGGPASAISVQRYQDDFSGSNVSSVTTTIKGILSSSTGSSSSARVAAVHVQTGRALIADVLATCRAVLRKAELEADAVLAGTSALRSQVEEAKAKINLEVFGSESKDGDEIAKAIVQAKRSAQPTLDALQWYKLFWRVDDVREAVTAAVDRAWCRDLERKLVFHAGRLGSLQSSFTESTTALTHTFLPVSPYHSPVLHNALARLASAPSFALTPTALTTPLHARQSQFAFPTARLHASAQRAVVGMSGSVLGGLGLAWAGWATELQLLGGWIDVGMSGESALGAGLLGAAVGVRWAVGRWERAKRRWWKDWDRVGDGLERDLKATLVRTMDEQVVVVPTAACAGIEEIVAKRRAEVEELAGEVQSLEIELGRPLDRKQPGL